MPSATSDDSADIVHDSVDEDVDDNASVFRSEQLPFVAVLFYLSILVHEHPGQIIYTKGGINPL